MKKRSKKDKQFVTNIKYEDISIQTKKRRFSKIEVDPYSLENKIDERSLLIKLKEYFYSVYRNFFIIKWQKRHDTWQDFKMIVSLILFLLVFLLFADTIFIILRAKGVI